MSVNMRKVVKKNILKVLNQSKTKSMYKLNIILNIQVHCHAVTTQNFNNALNELIAENEIEVEGNLVKISNKKFLLQGVLI